MMRKILRATAWRYIDTATCNTCGILTDGYAEILFEYGTFMFNMPCGHVRHKYTHSLGTPDALTPEEIAIATLMMER